MLGRVFLGRYEVQTELGKGGMGCIYLARHRTTGRQFVLKVMHEHIARQPQFRDLFRREVECLKRFQHPYAVALYDASLQEPPCLVMDYVRGTDFRRLLDRHRRFAPQRLGRLLGQLCEVLAAAHSQQIVHRDLKPANLMIVDWDQPLERVKVIDFGLALQANNGAHQPAAPNGLLRMIMTGTPEYSAPEQAAGRPVDGRSDLYSVGVILFEMLTGRLPFERRRPTDYALAHINDPPPTFAAVGAANLVSPAVEAVVQYCLAKTPERRPASALELGRRWEEATGEKILDGVLATPLSSAPETVSLSALRKARQEVAQASLSSVPSARVTQPSTSDLSKTLSPAALRREVAAARAAVADPRAGRPTMLAPQENSERTIEEYRVEATMLLAETLERLTSFAQGLGGKVIGTSPDVVRVLLGKDCSVKGSTLRTSGSGSLPALTEMELQIARKEPRRPDCQVITLKLSPVTGGSIAVTSAWRAWCQEIHGALRRGLS